MVKLFLKDSFLYTLSNVLTKGIGFIMLPIYTTFFNPSEFGVLDMLLVTGNVLSIIIGLEIHQAVARFFPEAQSFDEKRKIVSTAFWAILAFYILFLVPTVFVSPAISEKMFGRADYGDVIFVALLSYGFNFLYYFSSAQLRWQLKAKENLFVSVLYSGLAATSAFVLLKYFSLSLEAVFYGQIIAAVVGLLFAIYFAREYYASIFDKVVFRRLTRFSLPLIFSTLTVYAMLYVDRLVINRLLTTEDLGLYGFAYRIASVVGLLAMGSQTALTPLIYNRFQDSDTPKHIAKLFHLFILGCVVMMIGLFVLSPYLAVWIGSSQYKGAAVLIPWVAFSILFTGISNFTPGIFIAKKTHLSLYINLASFVLNLFLSYGLIKLMGLQGAVLATAICSLFYFFMYYYMGQKYYFIPFFWTKKHRGI